MADVNDVIEQMEECGLSGAGKTVLKVDGKLHRFKTDLNDSVKLKDRGWYILFDFVTCRGERLVSGSFGWFVGDEKPKFNVSLKSGVTLSAEDRERLHRESEQKRRIAEQEQREEAKRAAAKAAEIWDKLPDTGTSPYLTRKKVRAFGLRFSRGSIVIPVRDLSYALSGLQFIDPDGNKKFLTGTRKKGRFHLIGQVEDSDVLAIAEGYATAASIHLASGWPVAVAFDAGNLKPVSAVFRKKYPDLGIVICGDDDATSDTNTGRLRACQAAEAIGGKAIFPPLQAA